MKRLLNIIIGACFALLIIITPSDGHTQTDGYIRSNRLGIAHISLSTEDTPETRYQQALRLGAGWNRFPIYWDRVEILPNIWDWSGFDRQVAQDLAHGLDINAILIGRPAFYQDGNRISGLHQPIYADGTDIFAVGKDLNPENPWARFVYEAVRRYMPGGVLETQQNTGGGVRVWEIWNEPDHQPFWRGSINDYARLLKVSYIVAKSVDPNAQIMFGGLLFPTDNNWLAQVLNIYINDPFAEQNNWYMDIVGVHSYADPWRSGWLVLNLRQTFIEYGIMRPIWLNETGIPVWDDYPGPTWESEATNRATLDQQAWFMIQSAVFAWSEGADVVMYHQLYDDCGDQPAGTNFPPHNGNLCVGDFTCFGDAHGMYRNTNESICFSQSPLAGTPRPVTRAYRLLAEVFGTEEFTDVERIFHDQRAVTITATRPRTNERISVIWNRRLETLTLDWEAVGENAELISLDGSALITPNAFGNYSLVLPPAIEDNYQDPPAGSDSAIGGAPYILIERISDTTTLTDLELGDITSPQVEVNPTPIPQPTPRATVNPADDTQAPTTSMSPLPQTSGVTFNVSWRGEDNSGIERYWVWVRVNGGEWAVWLDTTETSGQYVGVPNTTYEFSVWAVDLAGNWSSSTDLIPQASTTVP